MFKKVKFNNGRREIYFGKKKIFEYVKQAAVADLLEHVSKMQEQLKGQQNLLYDINRLNSSMGGGFYSFSYLLNRAFVAFKYHKIFYDFYLRSQNGEELVFVDGGVHNGVFSDIALACGGICYGFEPNVYLCAFLKNLYKDNPKFILHQEAIFTQNGKTIFYDFDEDIVSQGASIVDSKALPQKKGYEVKMIDFAQFIKDLVKKHGRIALIKLDIEGAEFDVLDALIEQNLHENIEYIMAETHERMFDNPKEKIETLQKKITSKGIKNIYLDWI